MVNNYLKVRGNRTGSARVNTAIASTVRVVRELPQIGRPSEHASPRYRWIDEWLIPFDDRDFESVTQAADVASIVRYDAKVAGYRDLTTVIYRSCGKLKVGGGSVL